MSEVFGELLEDGRGNLFLEHKTDSGVLVDQEFEVIDLFWGDLMAP